MALDVVDRAVQAHGLTILLLKHVLFVHDHVEAHALFKQLQLVAGRLDFLVSKCRLRHVY